MLTNLYVKDAGTGEQGLGLTNAPQNEIKLYNMVEIATNPSVTSYKFKMNSTTNGEGWDVYGSDGDATGGSVALTLLWSDGTDNGANWYSLSGYNYYYFTYDGATVASGQGDNVLLNSIQGETRSAAVSPTPLPPALPLFASGMAAMGLLGWRKKRKKTAAMAAA